MHAVRAACRGFRSPKRLLHRGGAFRGFFISELSGHSDPPEITNSAFRSGAGSFATLSDAIQGDCLPGLRDIVRCDFERSSLSCRRNCLVWDGRLRLIRGSDMSLPPPSGGLHVRRSLCTLCRRPFIVGVGQGRVMLWNGMKSDGGKPYERMQKRGWTMTGNLHVIIGMAALLCNSAEFLCVGNRYLILHVCRPAGRGRILRSDTSTG